MQGLGYAFSAKFKSSIRGERLLEFPSITLFCMEKYKITASFENKVELSPKT